MITSTIMDLLPNELIINILSYCDYSDIISISEVSKQFNDIYKYNRDYISKRKGYKNFKIWYYKEKSKNNYDKMIAMCIMNLEKDKNVIEQITKEYLEKKGAYDEDLIILEMKKMTIEKMKMGKYINFEDMNNYYFEDCNSDKISIKREEYLDLLEYALDNGNEKMIIQLTKYIEFIDYIQPIIAYGKRYPNILKNVLQNNKYRDSDVMVRYSIGYNIMHYLHVYDLYDSHWKYLGEKYEIQDHNKINEIYKVIKEGDIYTFNYILHNSDINRKRSLINNINYIRFAARIYKETPEMLEFMLTSTYFRSMFLGYEINNVLEENNLTEIFSYLKKQGSEQLLKFYRILTRNIENKNNLID
jgi:hypothetical protein